MSNAQATDRLVLGLDMGTQSLRAALVDLKGRTVAYGVEPIETTYPRPAWAEQEPRQWWAATRSAIAKALEKSGASPGQIAAIGLDCTACTVLACDLEGNPLRPALLWMDQRSYREADAISATADPILRYVSGRVSPEWMLPKALWLKNNEPDTYRKAGRIVECTNWMMYKLTGHWTLSLNHVAVKWNYARPDGGWPLAMMAKVGLDDLPGKWPDEIVPLGKGDDRLSARAAEELGLKAGTPVAQGGIDAYLGMLGLGATNDGDVAAIVGSSTCHLAQCKDGVFGSGAAGCYPDATVEGLYTIEAGQTATGSILDWYRRHFAAREQAEADRRGVNVYSVLDEEAAKVPPGADGLVVRDDFQGNRSPYKNPQARGAIVGLSLAHGPGHIFRALYEATACGTRHILEDASKHGLKVHRVFLGGGGAKSPLWLQIHADILKRPVLLTRESESCALGSAMIAAIAAGEFADLDEAARAMVAIEKTVDPNPANADAYDELFAKYVDLYSRLNA
ncbi:Ribulokinase [Aquisphaera giovannonii]|uniref:Ribulokinase n=1 Tax=Aquisphaera giovannonii TaxID=406548 RepID=A0A5B9VYE1_9BACT|nr:FGGY-family carbohydrate kinase [Aquisphaera giovannonii]QEH33363.1 Ribulokinase [Aquisphaera giovannonii]